MLPFKWKLPSNTLLRYCHYKHSVHNWKLSESKHGTLVINSSLKKDVSKLLLIDQTAPLRLRDTRGHVRRNIFQGYVVGTSPGDVIRCISQGYPRSVIQGRYRDMFQGQVCVCDYTFYSRSIYPRGNLSPRRVLLVNCTARTNVATAPWSLVCTVLQHIPATHPVVKPIGDLFQITLWVLYVILLLLRVAQYYVTLVFPFNYWGCIIV